MGLLVAFAAGCVVGAKAGSEDFSDVVRTLRAVRESEEFHDLLSSLRTHAARTLRGVADLLDTSGDETLDPQDLVERVQGLIGRR